MKTIIYLYTYIAEAMILWNYAKKLFPLRTSARRSVIVLITLYLLLWVVSFSELIFLNTLSFTIANFLFFLICFSMPYKIAAFHTIVLTLVMNLCELSFAFVYTNYHPDFWDVWFQTHTLLIYAAISKILYFLATLFLIRIQKKSHDRTIQTNKSTLFITVITICSVLITVTLFMIGFYLPISGFIGSIIIIPIFLMLIVLFLVYALHNHMQKSNAELLALQTLRQKERDDAAYYQLLTQQNENQRILIHDIRNHLQSIAALNTAGEADKLSDYVEQLVQSPSLQPSIHICDNRLLNSILYRYRMYGRETGVDFHPDIRKSSVNFLDDEELTSLFCNLLDNAFAAAPQVDNPYVDLRVEPGKSPVMTVLSLSNSSLPPIRDHDGRLVSAKTDHGLHGYGLKSVKRIVKKYHGEMQTFYDDSEQCFHTVLTFQKPSNSAGKENLCES